jgi:hypothetical protein
VPTIFVLRIIAAAAFNCSENDRIDENLTAQFLS